MQKVYSHHNLFAKLSFLALLSTFVLTACQPQYDLSEDFVVADLFATPGKSLATVAVSPTPQPPSGATELPPEVAIGTLQPTQPLPTIAPLERPTIGPDSGLPSEDGDDTSSDPLAGLFSNNDDSNPFAGSSPGEEEENEFAEFDALENLNVSGCTPIGPFVGIYENTPRVADSLGCPRDNGGRIAGVYQPFERGAMFWRQSDESVFVIATGGIEQGSTTDEWWRIDDTWSDDEPETDPSLEVPSGRQQPKRGFGKVWRENAFVREALGWATGDEVFDNVDWQEFEGGFMFSAPGGQIIYVMIREDNDTGLHLGPLP